jgi:hypothetical protein
MNSGESKMTSKQDRRGFVTQKTPAIFMSSYGGITVAAQDIVIQILNALEAQKQLYASIFTSVENHIGLEPGQKIANYLHLRGVVGYDQHTKKFYARGVQILITNSYTLLQQIQH